MEQRVVEAEANSSVTLTCLATGHPPVTTLHWSRARDDGALNASSSAGSISGNTNSSGTLLQETNVTQISEVTFQAQLTLESLQREDNGTYVCYAANEYNVTMALQDVLVLGELRFRLLTLWLYLRGPWAEHGRREVGRVVPAQS